MRAARVDDNQGEIVAYLRSMVASVQVLSAVGKGCPDLLVGYRRRNVLIEVKDGDKPPSKRKLTPDEREWHALWRGEVRIAESIDDARSILEAMWP